MAAYRVIKRQLDDFNSSANDLLNTINANHVELFSLQHNVNNILRSNLIKGKALDILSDMLALEENITKLKNLIDHDDSSETAEDINININVNRTIHDMTPLLLIYFYTLQNSANPRNSPRNSPNTINSAHMTNITNQNPNSPYVQNSPYPNLPYPNLPYPNSPNPNSPNPNSPYQNSPYPAYDLDPNDVD